MTAIEVIRYTGQDAAGLLCKTGAGHKFDYGSALVLCGGAGQTGAGRLAARAALRVGAGLVTLGAPKDALPECAAQITSEMLREIGKAAHLRAALDDRRITALCLGPGMAPWRAPALLSAALRAEHAPYVLIDAGGLTGLARHAGPALPLNPRCVITPHEGEFARLLPDLPLDGPRTDARAQAVAQAAQQLGCTVLLKGAVTLISDETGTVYRVDSTDLADAAWLATAGSGDVLAGIITGLLARGLTPALAGRLGAWVHLRCAVCAGPGLISQDLPEQLPQVLRDMCAS